MLLSTHTLISFFVLFPGKMSEDESTSRTGTESLSMEIKSMMSNMFADFKTDIMQSVIEAVESRINEWYEEYDYSAEDEPVG